MKKKAVTMEIWQKMAEILGGPEKACQYFGKTAYSDLGRPSDVGGEIRLSLVRVLGLFIRTEVVADNYMQLYKKRMGWLAKHDVDQEIRKACQEELGGLKELSG